MLLETMTDKTEKVAVDPETVFKRPRECDSPSYQKRQKMALLARKQGAGDSLTAGSAMSKEKKHKTGDGIPPIQLDSQIDDFAGFSKDELMQKPGSNAPVGGIITSNFSEDDLKCREIDPIPKSQEEINADIKRQLVKEIRSIGRKYEKIFKLLEEVQGPIEVKKLFFESIIKEAARCMSRDFVQLLEKKLEHMIWEYLSMEDYDNSNA
ncbi:PREDICTED: cancer/testis antigen family 45 member A2-like isoform X1 [Mandrillus leucophaeus]|nr:PREDICTED: cancer/testis antigen family 45 member A2-like isoform X1 [Mandrillus leucophaeus]